MPDIVAHRIAQKRNAGDAVTTVFGHIELCWKADAGAIFPELIDFRVFHHALHASRGRGFGIGAAKFRVVGGTVIALAIVFPDELPVALFDDRAFEGDLGVLDVMRREIGFDQIAESREVRRFLGDADVDIARDGFAMDRLQAIFGRFEIRPDLSCEEQAAVEFVGPLVIGADELCGGALFGSADTRAAMAAGIMESTDAALRVAHDDDRICADLHGQIGAGHRQFAIMADEQPVLVENVFQIQLVIFRVGVEFLLQAEIGVAPGQKPQHFVANVHSLDSCFPSSDRLRAVLPATTTRSRVSLSSGSTACPVISMACPQL